MCEDPGRKTPMGVEEESRRMADGRSGEGGGVGGGGRERVRVEHWVARQEGAEGCEARSEMGWDRGMGSPSRRRV